MTREGGEAPGWGSEKSRLGRAKPANLDLGRGAGRGLKPVRGPMHHANTTHRHPHLVEPPDGIASGEPRAYDALFASAVRPAASANSGNTAIAPATSSSLDSV